MFVHGCASREARDVGDRRRAPGRDDDRLAARRGRSSPTTTRRSPSSRPCPRTSVTPRSVEPWDLGGVVEVVDHLVATGEHGRDVERPGRDAGDPPRLGGELDRPQQRLRGHARVEGAFPADEALLHDRHFEPRLAQAPGDAPRPAPRHRSRSRRARAPPQPTSRRRSRESDDARHLRRAGSHRPALTSFFSTRLRSGGSPGRRSPGRSRPSRPGAAGRRPRGRRSPGPCDPR